jgi:hypothetical protein
MKFHFDENLYGTFTEIGGSRATGRFDFTCRIEAEGMVRFATDRMARLTGTAVVEGLGEGLPIEGTLKLDAVAGPGLVYDFSFRAGASRYRFLGRMAVDFTRPLASLTTMTGRVEKDGVAWADVVSHFAVTEMPSLLWSFRARP